MDDKDGHGLNLEKVSRPAFSSFSATPSKITKNITVNASLIFWDILP